MVHTRGRPTKYKPEYCQQMIDFFSVKPKKGAMLPTFERFAMNIDVDDDTLVAWRSQFPKYSAATKRCKNLQKEFLNHMALTGIFKENYSKFVAINITNMRDRVETINENTNVNIDYKDIENKTSSELEEIRKSLLS